MNSDRRTVLNWTMEGASLRDFLSSPDRVAHVRGPNRSHWQHFLEVIRGCADHASYGTVVVLDPHHMVTSTPIGCLRTLARELGIHPGPQTSPPEGQKFLSDIRARGSISMTDVSLVQNYSSDEGEEFDRISQHVLQACENGTSFAGAMLVVPDVHLMEKSDRRAFMASLWEPLIRRMCGRGLKAIFLYTTDELDHVAGSIPPEADKIIDLPLSLDGANIVAELAELVRSEGWHDSNEAVFATARTLLDVSDTTQDLYANLAKLGRAK